MSDGGGLTPEEVLRLGDLIDGMLPDDYLAFLHINDGATPDRSIVVFATPRAVETTAVSALFSLTDGISETQRLLADGLLPRETIVIGEDAGGNYFVLSVAEATTGVWFWDHERVHSEQNSAVTPAEFAQTLTLLAPTFSAFLAELMDRPEADARIVELSRQPLPPDPGPATPTESGHTVRRPLYSPGPPVGSPDDIQVYRPSHMYSVQDGGPVPQAVLRTSELTVRNVHRSDGKPLGDDWVPPTISWFDDAFSFDLLRSTQHVLFRQNATELLRPILEQYGELLQVDTDTEPVVLFRCLNHVDALAPTAQLQDHDGRYFEIIDYDFVADRVRDAGIFVIPQQPWNAQVFFTRPVVQKILDSGIRCPPFNMVWSQR